MIGININETKTIVSESETDMVTPTKFTIGLLDPDLMSYLEDQALVVEQNIKNPKDTKIGMNQGSYTLSVLRFGLRNIENLIHPQTKQPVPFETVSVSVMGKNYKAVTPSIIALLPKKVREELAAKIMDENFFTKDEEKN